MNEKLKKITEKIKNPKILIIVGFIGIGLIFLSSLIPKTQEKKDTDSSRSVSAKDYKDELERSLKVLVSGISGDPDPTVIVTLESGVRYSYADSEKSDQSSSEGKDKGGEEKKSVSRSYVIVKSADGSEGPLLVSELMPQVRGVAVICEGGYDETVSEEINNAVTAALNITSKRVYISGGNTK